MEKGDLVKITDESWIVRVDQHEKYGTRIDRSDTFEVLSRACTHVIAQHINNLRVHDVFIKSTRTGKIYLHTEAQLRPVDTKVKVTCEGKDTYLCREDAKKLNLI